jgi:hypothetical protein
MAEELEDILMELVVQYGANPDDERGTAHQRVDEAASRIRKMFRDSNKPVAPVRRRRSMDPKYNAGIDVFGGYYAD